MSSYIYIVYIYKPRIAPATLFSMSAESGFLKDCTMLIAQVYSISLCEQFDTDAVAPEAGSSAPI